MYPDPVLTANIYCADRLDEVLHQVVGPSWRAIRQREPESDAYLWTLRSGEGGEHLKVRLHGPPSLADPARVLLQQAATAFFARLDGAGSVHPDHSLVWTRYRRSHLGLGGDPFLDDDGYVSRVTRCLAAACERVLLLEPDATGRIPHRVRQGTLLEAMVAGLGVPGFAADERLAYLAYHRDLLLRAHVRAEAGRRHDLLQLFEQQAEAMGPAAEVLRLAVLSVWARDSEDELDEVVAVWCRALAHLLWYVRPLCEDPDDRIDPQAEDPCFVPVFKALHGFANQLGLDPVEESFAHHFLGSVSAVPVHASQ